MIRKFLAPMALIGTAALATAAFATVQSKTGEIKSTDSVKHEIILSTGDTFELGSSIKMDKLKIGEKVKVTFEQKDGKMTATKVEPAK